MKDEQPTARYRAGNGAVFSSTKCPPGPDLASHCELPFGVVWTPFSPLDPALGEPDVHPLADEALPPVLCLTCLSYLNLFSQVREEGAGGGDGGRAATWACEVCGAQNNVAPTDGRYRTVRSPTVEFRQRLGASASSAAGDPSLQVPADIRKPRSASDSWDPSASTVVILMDENLPREEAQAVVSALQMHMPVAPCGEGESSAALLGTTARIGLVVFGRAVTVYQLGISSGMAVGDVFASHRALDEARLRSRPYLVDAGGGQLEGVVRCVSSAYGIGVQGGEASLDTKQDAWENHGKPTSRLEMLKRRKEARILQQQAGQHQQPRTSPGRSAKSPWELRKEQLKATKPADRCVGEALQVAIDLLASACAGAGPTRTSRILLFTNGCPNFGDGSVVSAAGIGTGLLPYHLPPRRRADVVDPMHLQRAVEFFGVLSRAASEMGVAVDVFCCGSLELALPAYHAIVEPSSGYVLSSPTFTDSQFAPNLQHVLRRTFPSGLHGTPLRDDNWVDGCIVDVRMPSFFTVTHIVGPGELIDGSRSMLINERSGFAVGASLAAAKKFPTNNLPVRDMVESTLTRIRLGRFDPLSTVSIMLRLNDFYQHESHAVFQFVARHVDRDGATLVTRVFTHRLSIAKDTVEFLDGVDEEVVPVLLAKEAVSRSMMGRELPSEEEAGGTAMVDSLQLDNLALLAQRDLDATIQRISGAFRLLALEKGPAMRGLDLTEEGGIKAAGSSLDFAFPPELADALQRLYHFRRGPLLSPGPMQSDDDRAAIRALFMRLPLDDCLSMMALSLWSSGPLGANTAPTMMTVPPDTLSLWDNCILAGDHYYVLFVWSGRATLDPRFDEIRRHFKSFLLERSRNRFPLPKLYLLNENESMSRRFTALLSPSHYDPIDHQLSNFPALGHLSMTELTALQSKFKFYDPETDASFRNWFWSVASASSTCKDEGVSLCE